MSSPSTTMCFVDTVWIKQMNFQYRGDVEVGHRHTHDHVTLLAQGSLQVIVGDGITEFTAPHMIVIQKDQEHILKALEDNTVAYCVHALRDDETGDIVSADQVPAGSLYFGRGGLEPVVKKPFTP